MNNKELLDGYLAYLTARGQSKNYYNTMKGLFAYLEENKIKIITQEVITQFFNSKNYSIKSRNQFILAGRNYYTSYMQVSKEQNEWYKIKLLKPPIRVAEYFTEKMLEEMKAYLITNHSRRITPIKIRAILDFLYYTGIRKTEMLTLKREKICLEDNTVKVLGKGNKERIVCFPNKVKKEIEQYFNGEVQENNAFNLTNRKLTYLIKSINEYCGERNIHCHSFRHGFAKNCLKKGVDLATVSRLLGHTNIATTMIYANPSEEEMQENYHEKMNKGKENE